MWKDSGRSRVRAQRRYMDIKELGFQFSLSGSSKQHDKTGYLALCLQLPVKTNALLDLLHVLAEQKWLHSGPESNPQK